ncbi:MAG: HEAT repeat domain-containing protein [Microcoleaceae cyanobacterium MO_207.B10]|nr:HEAT repeat domain-containing protein [Microcoleaceae cyanobacterium MO_207.B10]
MSNSLFERLKHPNPHLRERAMWEIVESRNENTIPQLMGILEDENVTYRRASVKTLGAIGADAVPALAETLLNSDNSTIRASCAKALAQVAVNYPKDSFPLEGIEALKTALNDPNPVVHIASVMALGEIGPSVFDILVEALNTTDNIALAVAIVNTLGSLGDNRAIEVLTNLNNDSSTDTYIRQLAVSALSRLELVSNYQQANAQH